jgi:hypothetical protein
MKSFSPILRAMAIGAILLAGVWLAIYLDNRLQPATEDTSLVEIRNIKMLRDQFNRDVGKTRLILLMAPT